MWISHLIFDQDAKSMREKKAAFFTNGSEENGCPWQEKDEIIPVSRMLHKKATIIGSRISI